MIIFKIEVDNQDRLSDYDGGYTLEIILFNHKFWFVRDTLIHLPQLFYVYSK